MKLYRAKDYAGAAAAFRSAIAADDKHVLAHYNLACVLALTGDKAGAIAMLEWLKASPDPQAVRCLIKAAVDGDLAALRGDPKVQAVLAAAASRSAATEDKDNPILPPLPLFVKEVRASSAQIDKADANRYAARNAVFYQTKGRDREDPLYETAWCEGKADEGIGESLTLSLALPGKLQKLSIAAGVWQSDSAWKSNNRITRLEVIVDGKPPVPLTVPAGRRHAELQLGAEKVSSIEIRIAAVDKGRDNNSCLSAVRLYRDDFEHGLLDVARYPKLNELPAALTAIQKALNARATAESLEPVLDFPFTYHEKDCILGGMCPDKSFVYKNIAALIKACRKFEKLDDEAKISAEQTCPGGNYVDASDTRPLSINEESPDKVRLSFPSHNELVTEWVLVHRGGNWRLSSIDAAGFDDGEGGSEE